MAKKSAIEKVILQCEVCKQQNYSVAKNKRKHPDRLEMKKYCPFDKKHTAHKEKK
ncbi:MAG TPA: 50S ribosomal protein L33 [Candidatus Omnitrophota bacterium]|nr:50S ribosomal protein L33 [Candidatus Omnitrophota bacterium]